jgi:hypothetical protein
MRRAALLLSMTVAVLLWSHCSVDRMAGNSSEVGNPTVVGVLYEPEGKNAAAGVNVVMRPRRTPVFISGSGALQGIGRSDSVVTNDSGRFAFNGMVDRGTYAIEAHSGNNAILIDSVVIAIKGSMVRLPPDTLKPAGAIRGVLRLPAGGDPQEVYIIAFGIYRFVQPDNDGNFLFAGLPQGSYDLRFIPVIGYYGVVDTTGISVTSADTSSLDTVSLPVTGTPVISNLTASYDTLRQIVTLHWNRPDTALVKSCNVYVRGWDSTRRNNEDFSVCNLHPITDTLYVDSTVAQDGRYEYCVVAIDSTETEGPKEYKIKVETPSNFTKDTVIQFEGQRCLSDFARAANGDFYILDDSSGTSIKVLDKALRCKRTLGNPLATACTPERICVDERGAIFVSWRHCATPALCALDSNGTVIRPYSDPALSQNGIFDIDARDSTLYVLNGGDSVSLYSYSGARIRSWQCNTEKNCRSIVCGEAGKIFVSNGGNSPAVTVFDSLGTRVSSFSLPTDPDGFAFDATNQLLFAICLANSGLIHGHREVVGYQMWVIDRNNAQRAMYKLEWTMPGGNVISIALDEIGGASVLISSPSGVLGSAPELIKLKPLPQ